VRKRQALERAAVGALAGIAAGLLAGAGARVAMRMVAVGVADGVGVRPEFTFAGTLGILIFGAIIGAPFGVLFEAIRERLPGPVRWRALIFAALCLVALGPLFFSGEEFFSSGRIVLFALLFPIYGIALGLAHAPTARLISRAPTAAQTLLAVVAFAGGAFIVIGLLGAGLQAVGLGSM
jgi:hypothetical protein